MHPRDSGFGTKKPDVSALCLFAETGNHPVFNSIALS
jgi:hypothetical protein